MANLLQKVFYIKSINMNTFKYIVLGISFLVFFACETDVPGADNTEPEFSFRTSNDGYNRMFTQDDDFENLELNLSHDADYDFIFSGGDVGATEAVQIEYPIDNVEFTSEGAFPPAPWELIPPKGSLSGIIFWEGNRNSPRTRNILNGTLRSNGELQSIELYFRVEDFGVVSSPSGITDYTSQILIANHTT